MARKNRQKARARAQARAARKSSPKSARKSARRSAPKTPTQRQQRNTAANMNTQQRRAGAKKAGVTLKDFKAGRTGANAQARKKAQVDAHRQQRQAKFQGQRQQGLAGDAGDNTFTTAAGYTMEKGAYNTRSKEMYEKYKTDNPNAGMSNRAPDNASFDADGYLSYDSTKPQWQANNMLKEAGYKAGDMLWKPGALDNLNGRKLTGRIARITELGNYIPEYEHDAVNSSHRSTGNPGYAGKVGLGADQYDYNRQYEQNNDVATAQISYNNQTPKQALNTANSSGNQKVTENYGSSQSDYEGSFDDNVPKYQNFQEQTGNMNQGSFASRKKQSNMKFDFNPYRFQQGQ